MLAIAFITFRESLEMLLIAAAVYSVLIENKISKKKELIMGASLGLVVSVLLFILISFVGSRIHFNVKHEWVEIFEGVNYIGTGAFLFLTAILLHNKMRKIVSLSPALLLNTSIFTVGFLSVLREGVEIIFFSISTSILSPFIASLLGFFLGISSTVLLGIIGARFASTKLSHRKILFVTEWGIKLLSLYFIIKGVVGLSEFII